MNAASPVSARLTPWDPRLEVNIPADRTSIAYQRGLRGLGLSHFFTA
jgi:vanillate O-demethylase monooxygenase subunit